MSRRLCSLWLICHTRSICPHARVHDEILTNLVSIDPQCGRSVCENDNKWYLCSPDAGAPYVDKIPCMKVEEEQQMDNYPKVCENCKKDPCPYAGNELAFQRIIRVEACAFNPKVEEKAEQKKSMGWKKGRQQK